MAVCPHPGPAYPKPVHCQSVRDPREDRAAICSFLVPQRWHRLVLCLVLLCAAIAKTDTQHCCFFANLQDDHEEFNQCQSQLNRLYKEGIEVRIKQAPRHERHSYLGRSLASRESWNKFSFVHTHTPALHAHSRHRVVEKSFSPTDCLSTCTSKVIATSTPSFPSSRKKKGSLRISSTRFVS